MTYITRERIERFADRPAIAMNPNNAYRITSDELRTICALTLEALDAREGKPEGCVHVSSIMQNKLDDMNRAYGILESQYRELRLKLERAEASLADAGDYSDELERVKSTPALVDRDAVGTLEAELLWQAYRGIRVLRDIAHAAAKQKKYEYGLGALQTRSEELLSDIEGLHPEFVAKTALRTLKGENHD